MADRPGPGGTQHFPSTNTTTTFKSEDSELSNGSQIPQESRSESGDTGMKLEDELDFRLRQLVKGGRKEFKRKRSSEFEFDMLENNDEVFGQDYGWECGICLEIPREACVTSCGHYFCRDELTTWMERNPNHQCPTCKGPFLTPNDLIPISQRQQTQHLNGDPSELSERSSLSSDRDTSSPSKETEASSSTTTTSPTSTIAPPHPIPFGHLRPSKPPLPRFGTVSNLLGHFFTIAAFAIFLFALFPPS